MLVMALRTLTMAGLVLIAVLSLGYAGYSAANPRMFTVTQQQFITNTQSLYNTQTRTVMNTVTNVQTVTSTATSAAAYTAPNYQYCGYNGCSYNYYYSPPMYASISDVCKSTGQNDTYQCSGYIYQPSSACTQLAVPYVNAEWMEAVGYLYLTLYNLPANHPQAGAWVTVTGTLNQGAPPYGYTGACPSNYINVNSIS